MQLRLSSPWSTDGKDEALLSAACDVICIFDECDSYRESVTGDAQVFKPGEPGYDTFQIHQQAREDLE